MGVNEDFEFESCLCIWAPLRDCNDMLSLGIIVCTCYQVCSMSHFRADEDGRTARCHAVFLDIAKECRLNIQT